MGLSHNTDLVLRNVRWRQRFTVYRTFRAANDYGRGETEETELDVAGEVQPTDGGDLERLDAGDRARESVTVWCATPLSAGGDNSEPDEIEYRGTRYIVRSVRDWTDYGAGFCRAVCVAQEMRNEEA
jgi:hypothetical protein